MATNGIKEIKISNTSYLIEPTLYASASATNNKTFTAALTNFQLFTGVAINITFATAPIANSTLNVNSTGAKAIYISGSAVAANALVANQVYTLVYNGTNWEVVYTAGMKPLQTAVTDNNASTSATTTFVQAVTQDTNGVITVTKAPLDTSGTWSGSANSLVNKTLSADTINVTDGTFAFKGSGYWGNTDWVGFQVASGNDKFQIAARGGTLITRQNDTTGGAESGWPESGATSGWRRLAYVIDNDTAVGSSTTPVYVSSAGQLTAGNELKPIAYKDSLAATDARIAGVGRSASWHKGRDSALIASTSISGYSPLASIKTTNGSWEIGARNYTDEQDDLLFTYVTDQLYNGSDATKTAQIKFLEDGSIAADITGTAANVTGTVAVANGGTGISITDAHKVLIGPTSGPAAAPTWRTLDSTDIPDLSSKYAVVSTPTTKNQLIGIRGTTTNNHHTDTAAYNGHQFIFTATLGGLFLWDNTSATTIWNLSADTLSSAYDLANAAVPKVWQYSTITKGTTPSSTIWYGAQALVDSEGTAQTNRLALIEHCLDTSNVNHTYIRTYAGTSGSDSNTYLRVGSDLQVQTNGHLYAGTLTTASERRIRAQTVAGTIYIYAAGTATGNRGIYGHNSEGTGAPILIMDQNNKISNLAKATCDIETSGIIRASGEGLHRVVAENTTRGIAVSLHNAASGNHGIYSTGYWNGTEFVSSSAWIVYRSGDGKNHFDGIHSSPGVNKGWHKGRDGALLFMNSLPSGKYATLASVKTVNGSWDIGAYDNTNYQDDLVFTYVTDTQYAGDTPVSTAQIKFLENGHIVADLDGISTSTNTLNNYFSSRQTSANLEHTENGGMQLFIASVTSGVMTTGQPDSDGYILNFNWDNASGWDSQLFIPDSYTNKSLAWRAHTNATTWSNSWKTIFDTSNYSTLLSSWTGNTSITTLGTIGTGTWQGDTIGTAYGGTGLTSYTATGIIYASDASTLACSTNVTLDNTNGKINITGKSGTSGEFIATRGSKSFYLGFGTGNTNHGIYDSDAPTAHWMIYSDTAGNVYLPVGTGTSYWAVADASTTARGLVNTTAQSFKGLKTFSGMIITGHDGDASRYKDIQFKHAAGGRGGRIRYDPKNTTNVTGGAFEFWQYSPKASDAADRTDTTDYAEKYSLPLVATALTADVSYKIITTKRTSDVITFTAASSSGGGIKFASSSADLGTVLYHNTTNLWFGAAATNTGIHTGGLYLHAGKTDNGTINQSAFLSVRKSSDDTTAENRMIVYGGTSGNAVGSSTGGPVFINSVGRATAITSVPVTKGGTGSTTAPTAGGIIYGSSTTAYGCTAAGTSGQVLISGGSGAPSWGDLYTAMSTNDIKTLYDLYCSGDIYMGDSNNQHGSIIDAGTNVCCNRGIFAGHVDTLATAYQNAALVIREADRYTTNSSIVSGSKSDLYAPRIGFVWNGIAGGSMILSSDINNNTYFAFYGTDGTTLVPLHASGFNSGIASNDYAEYRLTNYAAQAGQCVVDADDGSLIITTTRLQPGAQIVSDTYGFTMGQDAQHETPVAVSGRVLAIPYRNRSEYHAGMAVCSGPNGTIDIMTREEIRNYPDCIVGIVSEIPSYVVWHNIQVNGRIWIKVY